MKKLLSMLVALVLCLSALAYAETVPATTAEATTAQKLEQMLPVLDSLSRTLSLDATAENAVVYDSTNPSFVWNQLHNMSRYWGTSDETAVIGEDCVILTGKLVRDYAAASFAGMQTLPEIPANPENGYVEILYDATADTYTFPAFVADTNYTVIERYAENADGVTVGFGLYDENNVRLGGFCAKLTPNLAAELTADSTEQPSSFPYCVTEAHAELDADFENVPFTQCDIRRLTPVEPTEEPTVAPTATPAATAKPAAKTYSKLSKGSRGDEVKALQKRLNDLGYDCGKADGVFGSSTQEAVRYFQDAIGVSQDGVAADSVQQKLFASNAPKFETYVTLKSGSAGIRVEKLQSRLNKLGYLDAPVDGEFGSRTKDAVKLFQKAAGLKQDGVAGTATLKALAKKGAPECGVYIELRKGDSGSRVKEMQEQLKKLGFLEKVNSSYDKKTVAAVEAFAKSVGVDSNGRKADAELIARMFSTVAPTPAPTTEPTVAPTVEPTTEPTDEPTAAPVETPTAAPVETPTAAPVETPTAAPVETPTAAPVETPTAAPVETPTAAPVETPTAAPVETPTAAPVETPTAAPAETPTAAPAETEKPTSVLTDDELKALVTLFQTKMEDTTYDAVKSVQWIQTALKLETINGVYDANTQAKVKEFQHANSLTETGLVDEATLDLLIKNA